MVQQKLIVATVEVLKNSVRLSTVEAIKHSIIISVNQYTEYREGIK
jgi:hypothetical protein